VRFEEEAIFAHVEGAPQPAKGDLAVGSQSRVIEEIQGILPLGLPSIGRCHFRLTFTF
jgi:hypothetical protein